MQRRGYEESYRLLLDHGFVDDANIPPMPYKMPNYNDEQPHGVSFFRTGVWDDDLSNLTLPRTYFCRSEVSHILFQNTDLSESRMCWNNFIEADFTDADLANSDLRRSHFQDVRFTRANLSGTDMRLSDFVGCDFSDATMDGAKLTKAQLDQLRLAPEQLRVINWQIDNGEEPGGG